jgi:hypothetical protein
LKSILGEKILQRGLRHRRRETGEKPFGLRHGQHRAAPGFAGGERVADALGDQVRRLTRNRVPVRPAPGEMGRHPFADLVVGEALFARAAELGLDQGKRGGPVVRRGAGRDDILAEMPRGPVQHAGIGITKPIRLPGATFRQPLVEQVHHHTPAE